MLCTLQQNPSPAGTVPSRQSWDAAELTSTATNSGNEVGKVSMVNACEGAAYFGLLKHVNKI